MTTLPFILSAVALVSAACLIVDTKTRGAAIGAAIVALISVAIQLSWIRLSIRGLSLGLVLGAILAILGGICLANARPKFAVAAATALTMAGALLLIRALL